MSAHCHSGEVVTFTFRLSTFVAPIISAGLLVAVPASASVTAPQRISATGRIVTDTALATGGGRTVILTASSTPRGHQPALEARLASSSRTPTLQRLATGRVDTPRIAVGADGTATAAWVSTTWTTSTLRVAVARPGERFGAPQVLASAKGTERIILLGGVAVTSDGRSVVTWRPNLSPQGTLITSGTPVQVATAPPSGSFGTPQTLGSSLYDPPAVGLSPNGTAIVAWSHVPDPPLPPPAVNVLGRFSTFAATLPPGAASFGPATELGNPSGTWAGSVGVSAAAGGAAVVWRETDTLRRVSALNTDGTFAAGAALPASGRSSISDRVTVVPLPGGTSDALWLSTRNVAPESDALRSSHVLASRQEPGGSFLAAQQLSSAGWLAGPPSTAGLADRTVAVWGETRNRADRVVVASRTASGKWGVRARIAAPDLRTFDVHAAAGTRAVTLTWLQHVGPQSQSGGIAYRATYRP